MQVLLTGGTGFIGSVLCKKLIARGHQVILLTRQQEELKQSLQVKGITKVEYPYRADSQLPLDLIERVDGIINMAGEPIFSGRWTEEKKRRILASRVNITRQLADALAKVPNPAEKVLVSASAVGFYGPRGEEIIDEQGAPGDDFLARVCVSWEEAAWAAAEAGARVVLLRTGIVIDRGGGALAKMLPPYKLFVGGPIGSGNQWISWIHREDMTDLYIYALENRELTGAVNATAPNPVTMNQLSKTIGKVLKRPSWFPVPSFLAKIVIGESAQVVVTGQRVIPAKLQQQKYKFRFNTIEQALEDSLL